MSGYILIWSYRDRSTKNDIMSTKNLSNKKFNKNRQKSTDFKQVLLYSSL